MSRKWFFIYLALCGVIGFLGGYFFDSPWSWVVMIVGIFGAYMLCYKMDNRSDE